MIIAPEIFTFKAPPVNELGVPGNNTLYWPKAVAVNGTNIFVADTQNSRIQVFNNDGSFNFTFGFPGTNATNASLFHPEDIFINSSGFIHIPDTFNNVIKVFNKGAVFIDSFGGPGQGVDQYYFPAGMTQNSSKFFIADTFNNRIVITDHSGNSVDTIP